MNISDAVHSYDVGADGRFLMIEGTGSDGSASKASSIVVVQNWFTELERRVPTRR